MQTSNMKLLLFAVVALIAQADAWFFVRNLQTTATADGMAVDDTCVAHGQQGDCEFFDCFERRLECGDDFYMERYGAKYCNRFLRSRASFTEEGQRFLTNSTRCMTQGLLDHYRRDYVNCHDLEHDAVALTTPCYTQGGFCEIIADNAEQFIQVFDFKDLFGTGSRKLWRELLRLANHCGGRALRRFVGAVTNRLSPFA